MIKTLSAAVSFLILFTPIASVLAQTLPADTTTDSAPVEETTPPPMEEMSPTAPAGPSISSVSVANITDTSAEIDVNSDEMVQGYVEYGTTEQYGASTPLSSEFTTSPTFVLENLSPETLYHYRVVIVDSAGVAAITGDETFTTLATPAPEPVEPPPAEEASTSTVATSTATTTPSSNETTATTTESTETASSTPQAVELTISNTETVYVSTSTSTISWQTNKDADSQVEYGTTNAYGSLTPIGTVSQLHTVSLSSLLPNTKYYYRAISKTSGEIAYSPAETFTTLKIQAAPTYPVISNVSTTVTATSTTVFWTTSEPATSDIEYGTTTSYGSTVGKDGTLTTSHTRTFANPATPGTYHFRIVSADSNGNTSIGKDRTFVIEPAVSSGSSTTTESVISEPAASSSEEILANIASLGAQAAAVQGGGGGGLPVLHTHPLLLNVTSLDGQVSFDWLKDTGIQNGTIHTVIVRKEGSDPVLSRVDGDIIYDGPSTTFTDTDVENGVEYHYALYSYDAYGRFTTASRFNVTPQANEEQIDIPAAQAVVTTPLVLSRDLHQGKQGEDVSVLQTHLTENGYYPEGLVTGYFGPLTQAAVIRYQQLNNISPAVGYVGPITREVLGQ